MDQTLSAWDTGAVLSNQTAGLYDDGQHKELRKVNTSRSPTQITTSGLCTTPSCTEASRTQSCPKNDYRGPLRTATANPAALPPVVEVLPCK